LFPPHMHALTRLNSIRMIHYNRSIRTEYMELYMRAWSSCREEFGATHHFSFL
jgi:hypothetical protein